MRLLFIVNRISEIKKTVEAAYGNGDVACRAEPA